MLDLLAYRPTMCSSLDQFPYELCLTKDWVGCVGYKADPSGRDLSLEASDDSRYIGLGCWVL